MDGISPTLPAGTPAAGLGPVGGWLTATGFAGITITTVLYALAPPAAGLPVHPFDAAAAMAGVQSGAPVLRAASLVGITADTVAATGLILVLIRLAQRDLGFAAAGWCGVLISVAVFTLVDAMAGLVLVPLATGSSLAGFVAQKRLFDALFMTGTLAFGIGGVLLFAGLGRAEVLNTGPVTRLAGLGVGAAALAASVACLAGLPLHLALGAVVGAAGLLFAWVGLRIAAM